MDKLFSDGFWAFQEGMGTPPTFDEDWTFYYDESGNCRIFSLTEDGVNSLDALDGDFVLAGVAHKGKAHSVNIDEFYEILEVKQNQKDIKFRNLYRKSKNFFSFMNEKRTLDFFKWLCRNDLYIHYNTLNNLFYSIVDIIDSLWEEFPQCFAYVWDIKNAFYDFSILHSKELINILYIHKYPNVENCKQFCDDICDLIYTYHDDTEYEIDFHLELLRQMLEFAGENETMPFVQNRESYILISEYFLLYYLRTKEFPKSRHYFDEEPKVQEKMEELVESEEKNYSFVKSIETPLVQVSDIIAGFLRKMFMFLDGITLTKTIELIAEESENQIATFKIIWELISKSNEKSVLFLKNSNTPKNINERSEKLYLLAYGREKLRNRELLQKIEK